MKKKYILFFSLLLFLNISNCKADSATNSDFNKFYLDSSTTCENSNSSSSNGNDCSSSVGFSKNEGSSSTSVWINDDETSLSSSTVTYSVVVLIDTSGSMSKDKLNTAQKIMTNLVKKLKELDANRGKFEVNICSFDSGVTCKGWKDVNADGAADFATRSNVKSDWTYIQYGLSQAYEQFNEAKHKKTNAPMVVLLTDGYPTKYSNNFKVGEVSKLGETENIPYGSYRYIYYTAKTLINLKKNLNDSSLGFSKNKYAKLVTVGIDMKDDDELANFLLNPTKDNYNNLSKDKEYQNDGTYGYDKGDYYSTEAITLYKFIKGESVLKGDAIARVKNHMEDGIYRGRPYKTTNGNNVIDFYFKNANNLSNWNKDNPLLFNLPFAYKKNNSPYTLKNVTDIAVFTDSSKDIITCKRVTDDYKYSGDISKECYYQTTYNSGTKKWAFKILKKGILKNTPKFTVRVYLNSKLNLTKNKLSNDSDSFENISNGEIVDSFQIDTSANVVRNIGDIISKTASIETIGSGTANEYTTNVSETQYSGACTTKKVTLPGNNYYYKIPSSLTFDSFTLNSPRLYMDYNDSASSLDSRFTGDGTTCVSIKNLSVDTVVLENSKLKLGPFGNVSYAGSGFTMENASLENSVMWYYSGRSSGSPVVNVKFSNGYYINGNIIDGNGEIIQKTYFISNETGRPLKINSLSNVSISNIYTNSSCTDTLSESEVNQKVIEKMEDSMNTENVKSSLQSSAITSYDSNDASKEDANVGTTVSSSCTGSFSEGTAYTCRYKISLNKGCIATSDNVIDGVKYTNGSINYLSNNDGKCSDIDKSYIDGTTSLDGRIVNQYFVPVKFPYENTFVKLNADADLSNFSGITIDYSSLSCKIPVDHGKDLWKCEDTNNCKIRYNYRTISNSDPFPKANVASNWIEWWNNNSNKNRIKNNSYSAINYEINLSKNGIDNTQAISEIEGGYSKYSSWSFDKSNNIFVNNFVKSYFNGSKGFIKAVGNTNYCSLGEYSENCDKLVGGS